MVGRYFGGGLPAATADGEAERAVREGLARAVTEADRRIGEELDFPESLGAEASLGALADQRIQEAGEWGRLPAGSTVTKGAVLFPRLS